jgi:hypothetical protein
VDGLGFVLRALPRGSRVDIPTAFATAGLMLDIFFIFIDPCAGRHLLSLLRQRK